LEKEQSRGDGRAEPDSENSLDPAEGREKLSDDDRKKEQEREGRRGNMRELIEKAVKEKDRDRDRERE
jgi:hypothetical protein